MPTRVSQVRLRYPLRQVTRSGLRSPCWAPIWAETSASMMPSTRTRSASRRKSTSPSIPRLRNNSKRSILCLTTVVLLDCVVVTIKDDAVVSFWLHRFFYTTSRYSTAHTDWARQMILQLRRWLPQRSLVLVGDSSYAVLDLLHCCQSLAQPVTLIARLRLDAALYEPAPARQPGRNGRPPLKGRRLPALKALLDLPTVSWVEVSVAWYNGATRTVELTSQTAVWYRSGKPPVPLRWVLVRDPQGEFATQALLCTDLAVDPAQILEWFVLRWQLEVTFQEVRAHLGVETQRQWSDRAIARTTPILMGLFSWTTLAAHLMQEQRPMSHRTAAWYAKPSPTFVDAIALVRRHLWLASEGFSLSDAEPDIWKVPRAQYHRLVDSLAYAA